MFPKEPHCWQAQIVKIFMSLDDKIPTKLHKYLKTWMYGYFKNDRGISIIFPVGLIE